MKHAVERLRLVSFFLSSVLLLAPGCKNGGHLADATASTGRPPAPVVVASVEQRDIPIQIKAIGNVEAYQTVQIRSQVNGQIQKIFFKEGEDVRQGQQLFQLDKRPFQADLEKAVGPVEARSSAGGEFAAPGRTLLRLGESRHRVPRTGRPVAYAQAKADASAVDADKAALEAARVQLQYTDIVAPIDARAGT